MGFFSFLARRRFYTGDAFFGPLLREEFDARTGHAWFVAESVLFTPTGRRIVCALDAPATGPTETQREFFRCLERRYDSLVSQLILVFEQTLQYHVPQFRIRDFATEFQLEEISLPHIPAAHSGPVHWEWSFSTVHDRTHTFTVYMHGDIPDPTVVMDG
ncbi:hypothetical protein [Hymenobacter agri]